MNTTRCTTITWMFPGAHEIKASQVLNGVFHINHYLSFSVVRDNLRGYNVVRADWGNDIDPDERETVMSSLLEMSHIKYNDLKEPQ